MNQIHELGNLPLSAELLAYYRQRLIKSEVEYVDAIERINDIKIEHNQYHLITREITQRNNELDQLKKLLSDSQLAVFEERKQLLRTLSENDDLKIRELADRKKIQYLLQISANPGEDGSTYFRSKVPKSIIKETPNKENEMENVLTIDMGFIDKQAYKLKLNAVETKLEEHTITYEAHIKQLRNENSVQMNDLQQQNDRLKNQLDGMLNENEKLRHISRENIRELLNIKRDSKAKERNLIEEKSSFYEEKNALVSKLIDLEEQYRQVEKNVETKYLKNQEGTIQVLKESTQRLTIENKTLRSSVQNVNSKYDKMAGSMQKRMEALSSNYLSLKKRRHFEIEGFTNDIISLRKQLKNLEKSILKYAPLADKEFLLLNIARSTSLKVESLSGNLHTMKNSLYQFEADLESQRF